MKKIRLILYVFIIIIFSSKVYSYEEFDEWKSDFKKYAFKQGISLDTLNMTIDKTTFLPNVIKYDRYQPEFYEDTKTYILKRTSNKKIKIGEKIYSNNQSIINLISEIYKVDKNLLLSLMGIETNFGNYLGKMDIISSLATLSFDKRRSEFFTSELITLLKLIDKEVVDPDTLYGSWAGAFGNFQFMPSTIKNYAIDFNKNGKIELKKTEDSFASAANYLKSIGWKKDQPCFFKINLKENIPNKYLNSSARKIKNKKKVFFFKKYISNFEDLNLKENIQSAIIIPDKDIIPGSKQLNPAYLIFENYEKILNWNRSLRFALAVCTLKDNFKNEI